MIENVIKTILSVVLISAFIGVFFFTYVAKVEEKIVKRQSIEIIKGFTEDIRKLLPRPMLKQVYDSIEPSLVPQDLSSEDEEVKISNAELIKKARRIIVIFTVIGLLLVVLLCFIFKVNPKDIIINTLVILVFVAVTEYVFVTYIVQNYNTIDSNFVKQKMINIVANYR